MDNKQSDLKQNNLNRKDFNRKDFNRKDFNRKDFNRKDFNRNYLNLNDRDNFKKLIIISSNPFDEQNNVFNDNRFSKKLNNSNINSEYKNNLSAYLQKMPKRPKPLDPIRHRFIVKLFLTISLQIAYSVGIFISIRYRFVLHKSSNKLLII